MAGIRRGVLFARQLPALATRLPIPRIAFALAASLTAVDPCAAQDATAFARAGTTAIETRRFGDALEAFNKAAMMQPADASICFGAGVAAFMLGQDDVAQMRFECALALNPAFLPAAVWLGDLHYRAGRMPQAIAVYETARQRAPNGHELQRQLEDWQKEHELQRRFRELRTEHFTAFYEAAGDEPIARKVVQRLEAAYSRIGETLRVYPSRRIAVVLYTREQFDGITRLARWSAAGFDGRIRLPLGGALEQPDELDRVLSHEFVHAVVTMVGGRAVPAWVNEGLATVLEPGGSRELEATLSPADARPPLSELHDTFAAFSPREAAIAYASSARAVRRLIEKRGAPAMVALLQDLSRGAPFPRAFQRRMAMPYEDFARVAERD